jgi:NAD kinase
LDTVLAALENAGLTYSSVSRRDLTEVDSPLVVSVGGDGTFLSASQYVTYQRMLGVNSDPERSTGFYCCANSADIADCLARLDDLPKTRLNRLSLTLDGAHLPYQVLNDVLIANRSPAHLMRYRLTADGEESEKKGCGLLVCTAAGSTAWMYQEGGEVMPIQSDRMQYLVRGMRGEVPGYADRISVVSLTHEGKVFADGEYACDLPRGSEMVLSKGTSLTVIGDLGQKQRFY